MRVCMQPSVGADAAESGIKHVILHYREQIARLGVTFVDDPAACDVHVVHAGTAPFAPNVATVAHAHGLYWNDHALAGWEETGNQHVIESLRRADVVTVPSEWVAESLRRDMRFHPYVVGHGVDVAAWRHQEPDEGYVVGYAKNRVGDACSPEVMATLASMRPHVPFVATFAPPRPPGNVRVTGVLPHAKMQRVVQRCSVFVSTTKETFGIGILEALAAGRPVLAFDEGGVSDLVTHGYDGFLAAPGDLEGLARGLDYCLRYRRELGANAARTAQQHSWETVAEQVYRLYAVALERFRAEHDVTVVIPCYNKEATLARAVHSALTQTLPPAQVLIVDNNSTDDSLAIAMGLASRHPEVEVLLEGKQGVAHARNRGIAHATTRYVCALDADDEIKPRFLEVCSYGLKDDPGLGVAYTGLEAVMQDGSRRASAWPGPYDFDAFLQRRNQVPTCAVFRRDLAMRLGGFRQRYAPKGAGAEDAEFWLRMGAYGYGGKKVTDEPLFVYHAGGLTGDPDYRETDWLAWHTWSQTGHHPFASRATPKNKVAHPVRAYDQPAVSVVIPCGPKHLDVLPDALDSLEAQTYPHWEAIVVLDGAPADFDTGPLAPIPRLAAGYTYAKWMFAGEQAGPGACRNLGAKHARGKRLLFLDADDFLRPDALQHMMHVAEECPEAGVYSDYAGYSYIEDAAALRRLEADKRVLGHDPVSKHTVLAYQAQDYDYTRAIAQPSRQDRFYLWCLITTLIPKAWHDEVGGFDETMASWEDWDYWIRLARRGKDFVRIRERLVFYRFYTGERRAAANPTESGERGRQLSAKLIHYMQSKYAEEPPMSPCRGCGGGGRRRSPMAPSPMTADSVNMGTVQTMSSSDLVWVRLEDGNTGQHPFISNRTDYGYRAHGDVFKMLRSHAEADHRVVVLQGRDEAPVATATLDPPPPPGAESDTREAASDTQTAVSAQADAFNFASLWGINEEREAKLHELGVRSIQGLLDLGEEKLAELLDIQASVARRVIVEAQEQQVEDHA